MCVWCVCVFVVIVCVWCVCICCDCDCVYIYLCSHKQPPVVVKACLVNFGNIITHTGLFAIVNTAIPEYTSLLFSSFSRALSLSLSLPHTLAAADFLFFFFFFSRIRSQLERINNTVQTAKEKGTILTQLPTDSAYRQRLKADLNAFNSIPPSFNPEKGFVHVSFLLSLRCERAIRYVTATGLGDVIVWCGVMWCRVHVACDSVEVVR